MQQFVYNRKAGALVMSAQRLVGLALVVFSAACALPSGNQAPRPIVPEEGPGGSLHVRYSGGLIYRTVDATFRVDENAYVLVGHLAGDGVIRVIHPTNPAQAFRAVRAGQSVSTGSFTAAYDGAPSAFSLMSAPFRSMNAMMDSYDGLGHGFVFMVVTRSPMDLDAITDGFEWDEFDVRDYLQTSDPRLAIRDFAESVTRGDKYTIKFAKSFSTQNFASYASTAFDCGTLASLGYGHLPTFWGSWGFGAHSYLGYGASRYGLRSGCGGHRYAYRDYAMRRQYAYVPHVPYAPPRAGGPTLPPPGPITPTLTRPTRRGLGEAAPGVLVGRSAIDRATRTTYSSRASELRRRVSTTDDENATERSARGPRPREMFDDYRTQARERANTQPRERANTQPRERANTQPRERADAGPRERASAPSAERPRAATPRSDSPRAGGSSPKADAPRPSAAPQRSSPSPAAPAKSTSTGTKQL
jgi:hypothetical protein